MYIIYEKDTGKIKQKVSGDTEYISLPTDTNLGILSCEKGTSIKNMYCPNGILTKLVPIKEKPVIKDTSPYANIRQARSLEELKIAIISELSKNNK